MGYYNICSKKKTDKVQVFHRFVLNEISTHVASCSLDFTPFAECGKLLFTENIFIYEIRSVNRSEFVIDITLSRGEQGFRFVFLFGNP